ncbi:MAG: ethanolamine ammonia-lyase subunit EutC, partial [Acidobacteria bacterium]|nr:ethanolamine ammonia-lyase subunit EutC [Acidobacteriota bacterium]
MTGPDGTRARIFVGRAGARPQTAPYLDFRLDRARARDAAFADLSPEFLNSLKFIPLSSRCETREQFLKRPDLGRLLDEPSEVHLRNKWDPNWRVLVVASDGLNALAAQQFLPRTLGSLYDAAVHLGIVLSPLFFVRYGRMAVLNRMGELVLPKAGIILLGERPGLGNLAISGYLAHRPRISTTPAEMNAISNISDRGLPPEKAGRELASLLARILE